MGCRKFTCMISTKLTASDTSGAMNMFPISPLLRNSMPALTAIMAMPMGTMISGSSVRLKPKYARMKPSMSRRIRAKATTGSRAKKVLIPGKS